MTAAASTRTGEIPMPRNSTEELPKARTLGEVLGATAAKWQEAPHTNRIQAVLNAACATRSNVLCYLAAYMLAPIRNVRVALVEGPEVAPGFVVTGLLHHHGGDCMDNIEIAAGADIDAVEDAIWEMFKARDAAGADVPATWFGPEVVACEPWCEDEHEMTPDSSCRLVTGTAEVNCDLPSGPGLATVNLLRYRVAALWESEACIYMTGIDSDVNLTPAAALDIAAALTLAASLANLR